MARLGVWLQIKPKGYKNRNLRNDNALGWQSESLIYLYVENQ